MNVIGLILGSIISITLALILDFPINWSEYVLILLVVLMVFTIVQALRFHCISSSAMPRRNRWPTYLSCF